jgi:hypothetical protein
LSVDIIQAIDDPELLAKFYQGTSWSMWRCVLKAAFCLPMKRFERIDFRAVAGNRRVPAKRVRELWAIVGRRGGKDSTAALVAVHAAVFGDYRSCLRAGEVPVVACIACDRDQAKIVLGYIKSMLREVPMFAPLIIAEDSESVTLATGVQISVQTNSYRAVRGATTCCCILDEVAYFRDEYSASPDIEVYRALVPGMATISTAMLIGISSPYMRSGLLFSKWRDHFGQDDDDVLVVGGPGHGLSLQFNPTLDPKIIEDALAKDRAAAAAEWLAEWRDDISGFLDAAWIDRAASLPPGELPPAAHSYQCFIDPSGGRSDAMTMSIAHKEGERVVIDLVRGRRPPFDPASVVAEFCGVMKAYRISRATSDRYAGEWVTSAFGRQNITVVASEKSKSEIYLEVEPQFAQGNIDIPADRTLLAELRGLERRTHRGGRDTVDHGISGHDDFANSACGAAWLVAGPGIGKGLLEWTLAQASLLAAPKAPERMQRVRRPEGSTVNLLYLSSRMAPVAVDVDGVIEVCESDAKALQRQGWQLIEEAVA